jgi:cation:H+ antiporter
VSGASSPSWSLVWPPWLWVRPRSSKGIRRISDVESSQGRLGPLVVGFATTSELVVLAWSSARRGVSAVVVAGVVGSFTYNVTMTLGAGALARPLTSADPGLLRGPWLAMPASLVVCP